MEWLEGIDHALLIWINQHYNAWLDTIMVFASGKFGWSPLYALILLLLYKSFGLKGFLIAFFAIVLTIALGDQISVKVFKEGFERYRPCHHMELKEQLRLIKGCGGQFGFLSSHATNSTSLATISILMLRIRWFTPILVAYFILNGYSRMYLGVHYPSDVVAGTLLGFVIGYLVYRLFLLGQAKLFKFDAKNEN